MNKMFLVLTLLLPLGTTHADEPKQMTVELCQSEVADTAKMVMGLRQQGAPLGDLIKIAQSELLRGLVMDAYSTPAYTTENMQQRAIGEFRDKWHLSCLKGVENLNNK